MRQRVLKKARSTEAAWDRGWAVTSASRSSCVASVAPPRRSMPWNGSRGVEGSRRTVRVADVIQGEAGTAVRETWPRAADASRKAARLWVESGKVN